MRCGIPCGSKWRNTSPRRPPTANATRVFKDAGSIFGGTSARKKLGGPEMYAVASYCQQTKALAQCTNELTAGVDGNRKSKIFFEFPACFS
jgi:hypothetical protein